MKERSFNLADVGASPEECERKAGRDGVAVVIGWWMFTHPGKDSHTFFGSTRTAARAVWGEETKLPQRTGDSVTYRLKRNGFVYTPSDEGLPRWRVPETWTWEHEDERKEADPVSTSEPAPVRISRMCPTCGEKIEGDSVALARHVHRQHRQRNPGELEREVLKAIRQEPGFNTAHYAERIGVSSSTVSRVLSPLVQEGRVHKRVELRGGRGGRTVTYRVDSPARKPQPTKTVVINPAPEPAPAERVIVRPDGSMWRVLRELPDGSLELERM